MLSTDLRRCDYSVKRNAIVSLANNLLHKTLASMHQVYAQKFNCHGGLVWILGTEYHLIMIDNDFICDVSH